ncbi:hypothetical protein [Antribacter gilvus]|uniref:hypothetical protein n=1 Tax=Antribacter gilvus TaxID=2304675 RepID=UPI000F7A5FD0|nr:hypothetical protein [Antribacter gilvus]
MAFPRFYRRAFLNKRGFYAGAYVHADIEVGDGFAGESPKRVDAFLTVADCGRTAQLDFTAGDRAFARNALFKARRLQKVVDEFVEALERAIDDAGLS